ncbi:MAG TPA: DEAD/DEAH box helicase [Saprospiraceae bacterium]|nr:DEAD/DEAH box helicase [Saprospiraceae bacterium]HMP25481.1 DEAD/DEAH box helicase [Saprospiraceae bacterium]
MTTDSYQLIYNLFPAEGLCLPEAYLATLDTTGRPAHIQQRAYAHTIEGFGLELTPLRRQLFGIIEQLQVKTLEQRFSPPKKAPRPLAELLEQEEVKRSITAFVDRKLDELLSHIVQHRLPLCWNVERRILVSDFLLSIAEEALQPRLYFEKTDEGVRYRLWLENRDGPWRINKREVVVLSNTPGWLIVDGHLYRLAHINGNMVKPFLTKVEINIPRSSVKPYFQKFILRVVAAIDIQADGFDIVQHRRMLGCRLEPVRDWLRDAWGLSVKMLYPGAEFLWRDLKEQRTTLEFAEGDDIRISKVLRHFKYETGWLEKLENLGLHKDGNGYFELAAATDDPLALLEWLAMHRQKLEQLGFEIAAPQIDGQTLYLQASTLQLRSEQQHDWFDLHGEVQVGTFRIPFLAFAKYIRDENRLYPLPNGEYFLIPQEWMTKYKALAQFADRKKEGLRLSKSHYMLLSEIGLQDAPGVSIETLDDFQISPLLKAELRPYQLAGVQWLVQLYENGLGACLADDMGLGKTLQTIAALLHAKAQKPKENGADHGQQLGLFQAADADFLQALNALIVLPASLVFNWAAELQRFAPTLSVYQHIGNKRHKDPRLLSRFDVLLTTYQTALRDVTILQKIDFEYIILDESQQIKNKDSKIFKAINELNARHKISLSGTPIENSLSDLWSQMQFINPNLLGSFTFFQREFITPIEKRNDEAKKDRLRSLVAPYLLRRTKEEVAKDLPPLTVSLHYCEMEPEQKKLYEREKSAARNLLLDNFQSDNPQFQVVVLQTLTKLRQLVNHPKLVQPDFDKASGKFTEVLEQWDVIRRSGHKALIFSSFVKYLDLFRTNFETSQQPYAWLVGDLNQQQRRAAIEKFQNDPAVQSFLISIKSGGAGLNLTAADYVFILDPWWNPFAEQQAIARAHRIGQDKNVIALKFITKDSIEEKILKLQERKTQLAEDIIAGAGALRFSRGELAFLLE